MKLPGIPCLLGAVLALGYSSCTKDTIVPDGEDPYQNKVVPLITLEKEEVNPARGSVGEEVTLHGTGFLKVKEKLSVFFNGQPGDITAMTDTTITTKVPQWASTGIISAKVNRQYFFGPFFRVKGPLRIDTLFPGFRGANASIYDIIRLSDGKYLIGGNFTNYDNANINGGVNRIARINSDGTIDRSFTYGEKTGLSGGGVIQLKELSDGRYLIAGSFSSFATTPMVPSIAILTQEGKLEMTEITRNSGARQSVPVLKGGVSGTITEMQVQTDGKIILGGSFKYYVAPDYYLTSATGVDSVHLDSTLVSTLVRLNTDGSLDTGYNYDVENRRGKPGPNGRIGASYLQDDGKLIIAGNFTKYNNQKAPGIVRLNTDGSIDPAFDPGAGADRAVYSIAPTKDGKFIVCGAFNNYGGKPAPHVVKINADGSQADGFDVGEGPDDYIYYANIMPGGEIILAGVFKKFDRIPRKGFVVLNPDGSLHETYNTVSGVEVDLTNVVNFGGSVGKIIHLPEEKAFIGVGTFTRFDEWPNFSIFRATYE